MKIERLELYNTAPGWGYGKRGSPILIFTLSLALEQLGIGQNTIVATFSILFGGIVLALAIAFGLGGRHLAKEFLERRFLHKDHKEHEEENQFSHL